MSVKCDGCTRILRTRLSEQIYRTINKDFIHNVHSHRVGLWFT